ncbi:hypothetical protein KHA80_22260 [Anaerobacillus sp. HL2]|nr:hypothetical protein KHA80_22260 [Anaerobacillus sp. HL2]
MPNQLQQAQQAVQQAHQHLLRIENQQLEQALFDLHQAQERVKQCQFQILTEHSIKCKCDKPQPLRSLIR